MLRASVFLETKFHCTFTTPSIRPLSAPTAMKQWTRRRMEQPINACGKFVCFTLRAINSQRQVVKFGSFF